MWYTADLEIIASQKFSSQKFSCHFTRLRDTYCDQVSYFTRNVIIALWTLRLQWRVREQQASPGLIFLKKTSCAQAIERAINYPIRCLACTVWLYCIGTVLYLKVLINFSKKLFLKWYVMQPLENGLQLVLALISVPCSCSKLRFFNLLLSQVWSCVSSI